jgi:hypothetical protein
MNDREREMWVLNDEVLYEHHEHWKRRNKGGMRGYLKEHREVIDAWIRRVTTSPAVDAFLREANCPRVKL